MQQYLLSIYQPDGEAPPPEALEAVMGEVHALEQEMQAAGAGSSRGACTPRARPRWCACRKATC